MKNTFYRLLTCKEIRNASAHSNCILNDLKAETTTHATNAAVTNELMKIPGMRRGFRKNRMSKWENLQMLKRFMLQKMFVTARDRSNRQHLRGG